MRRGLASLIMGLSLLLATASWAGFIMSRTVLDPGRSERLADTLLDNEDVRAVIVDRLSDSIEGRIPADVPVDRATIEQAAEVALEDPRVEALIRDGFVTAHQNALNGIDEPVMIDAGALGAAGRDAVVAQRPELDSVLPAAPEVEVELPNTGLSWLGTVKRYVDRFTIIGAAVALSGVVTAFVLARNRAAALRRVAFWAFGASAFWIIVAYAAPWVLERIAPSSVSIAMAAIDVFFGAMIRPAITLAGIGLGLLLLSFVWPARARRKPAADLDRAARGSRGHGGVAPAAAGGAPPGYNRVLQGDPRRQNASAPQPQGFDGYSAPQPQGFDGYQTPQPGPASYPSPAPVAAAAPPIEQRTQVFPDAGTDATRPFPQVYSKHGEGAPGAPATIDGPTQFAGGNGGFEPQYQPTQIDPPPLPATPQAPLGSQPIPPPSTPGSEPTVAVPSASGVAPGGPVVPQQLSAEATVISPQRGETPAAPYRRPPDPPPSSPQNNVPASPPTQAAPGTFPTQAAPGSPPTQAAPGSPPTQPAPGAFPPAGRAAPPQSRPARRDQQPIDLSGEDPHDFDNE